MRRSFIARRARCRLPPPAVTGPARSKSPWQLDRAAWESLLAFLSEGDGPAAYERLREKLEAFFRWRGAADPPALIDLTFDRVAKKLAEGTGVHASPARFVLGVARLVLLEQGREQSRERTAARATPPADPQEERLQHERRMAALERCLSELDPKDADLLLRYHQEDGRDRIDGRQALARELGLPLATLRVRAFRIRARLERCIEGQLGE